jgi:hypothetical protein
MQSADWIDLFRRIPPSQHDCLMLTTTIGTEIVLQRLIRLEQDFLIAQGRMAGSTDQGKMLMLPYDKLTYIAFNKKMTDAEMHQVLGSSTASAEFAATQANTNGEMAPEVEMEPAPSGLETHPPPVAPPPPPPPPPTGNPSRALPPSKTVLLARLRQRLASEAAKPPNPNP